MRTVLAWVDRRRALPAQQALASGGDAAIARDLLDGIVTTTSVSSAASGRRPRGRWVPSGRNRHWLPPAIRFRPGRLRRLGRQPCTSPPRPPSALVAPLVVGLIDDVRRATYDRAADGPARSGPGAAGPDELANIALCPSSLDGERGRRPGPGDAGLLPGPVPGPPPVAGQADGFPRSSARPWSCPASATSAPSRPVGAVGRPRDRRPIGVARPGTLRPTAHGPARGRTDPDRRTARDPVATPARPGRHHPRSSGTPWRSEPATAGLVPARPGHVAEPWRSLRTPDRALEGPRAGLTERAQLTGTDRVADAARPGAETAAADPGPRITGGGGVAPGPPEEDTPSRPSSSGGRTPGADPSRGTARPAPGPSPAGVRTGPAGPTGTRATPGTRPTGSIARSTTPAVVAPSGAEG